jgi:aryl-alcohol dehydrogenase-like predicted oxidoreductase
LELLRGQVKRPPLERESGWKERCTVEYVNLGKSGLRVSRICLGTMSFGDGADGRPWVVSDERADEIFRTAVEAGVIFVDTADTYSRGQSEEVTGKLVKKYFSRDEVVLATKVFMPMTPGPNGGGLSAKHILSGIDASLARLGLDYVDLYQIHRFDPNVPIEETMGALDEVVRSGKARYIGASSMYAWQFAKAQSAARDAGGARFISMQNHYNAVYREEEREMIPLCGDQGIGVIPWSPLARGLLAGSRTRAGERLTERAQTDAFADMLYTDDDFDVVDAVERVAHRRGLPMAQIALAWLLARSGVTAPIVGATKVSHVSDAVAAEKVELTSEEIAEIEAPYRPHPILGH